MTSREFTLTDSIFFAKCSGDYNPIHIDPVLSRRLMFGEPIVHGIHVVLWALDSWLSGKKNKKINIVKLNVGFPKAVVLKDSVVSKLSNETKDEAVIEIIQKDVVCSKIKINYTLESNNNSELSSTGFINGYPPDELPRELNFEDLKNCNGILNQFLDQQKFSDVFPNVYKHIGAFYSATLLSSTRVVGMYCPGLNSLISSLEFSFSENDLKDSRLKYEVSKIDERFNMLFIKMVSTNFNAKIRTFMRPSPINQLGYLDVVSQVKPDEFKGQKVLIVGGSRGLGEITTKILVAGGASVRFTYNRGLKDAEKIEKELRYHKKFVTKVKLDVLNFSSYDSIIDDDWTPSHCYYFATPFIFSGVKGIFSESLFNQFNSVYITAFIKLVNFLKQKGTYNYFYPSTVAIDEMPENMVEYTISKFSAQKACEILRKSDKSLKIETYKFPRMETDQTVSFLPVKNHDPLEYSLSFIRSFNSANS